MFTHLRGVGRYNESQSKFYAAQVASIFHAMHNKDIAYRDLKPENILINRDGYLKLVDFGFAKIVTAKTYTVCGTPEYLAPEIINKTGHNKSVDWWALGILIQEMITGLDPFTKLTDNDPMGVYKRILDGKIKFHKSFPKYGRDLVKKLVTADLSKRLGNIKSGSDGVLKHDWFKDIKWNDLENKSIKAPYFPKIDSEQDTTNFEDYPESKENITPIKENEDPFLSW